MAGCDYDYRGDGVLTIGGAATEAAARKQAKGQKESDYGLAGAVGHRTPPGY
jgi:hypothetical protein